MNEYTQNALIEYLFKELMETKRLYECYHKGMDEAFSNEAKYEKKIIELEDKIDEQAEHIEWLESIVDRSKKNTEVMGEALEDSYNRPLSDFTASLAGYFTPSTSHEEEKIAKKWNDAIEEALNDHDGEGI